ncbi:MAG: lytic transglycosylase, partial [Streptomycetaceae bacterium]|nr:lytic transglycosylase [Streptomycetaceae bacterium]
MQRPTMPTTGRLAKARKYALGGIAAAGLAIAVTTVAAPSASAAPRAHGNVDIWIKKSLAVMHKKGIPGSYDSIYRNLMRESAGNPHAINNWDSNAK